MELWSVIVRFFQGGGEFMLPIAVVSRESVLRSRSSATFI